MHLGDMFDDERYRIVHKLGALKRLISTACSAGQ